MVQHRTLVVFPQRDGVLTVPPLVARWNDGDRVEEAKSETLTFSAAFPPRESEELVIAPRVSVEQKLDRPLSHLRVGDGFTRTVVLSANDSDPLVLPTLTFARVSGLSVYPAAPRDVSSGERGQLTATRTFSATYVVERVGRYELDAVGVTWLEPASGRFATTTTESLHFWARPNPGLGWAMWGTASGSGLLGFGAIGLTTALFVALVWRRFRHGPFAIERWWAARRAERRAFSAFLVAVEKSSATAALRAAYEWLGVRFPRRQGRTLDPLRAATPEVARELALLERSAFAEGPPSPSSAGWRKAFRGARNALAKGVRAAVSLNQSFDRGDWGP